MKKIAKKFYLEESNVTYLKVLRNQRNISESEIVNNAIKIYFENNNKHEEENTRILKTLEEIRKIICSFNKTTNKNINKTTKLLEALWLWTRVEELPVGEPTNLALAEFESKLENDLND